MVLKNTFIFGGQQYIWGHESQTMLNIKMQYLQERNGNESHSCQEEQIIFSECHDMRSFEETRCHQGFLGWFVPS